MTLLDMITCEQLLAAVSKPVAYQNLGEIFGPIGYERPKPFFADVQNIEPQILEYYNLVYRQHLCEPRALHLLSFDKALVVGQGAVVVDDKYLLFDSVAEFVNHGNAPDGIVKDASGFSIPHCVVPRVLGGITALVKRPWYKNFGHWLVDLMPMLPALSKASKRVDNIIFGDVPAGNLRSIMDAVANHFYPDATVIYMSDAEQIRTEQLLYFEPLHVPPLFKHPQAIHLTRSTSEEIFRDEDKQSRSFNRIYISRQKVGIRAVSNYEAVESLLHAHNFEILYPETMTFSQQIASFANADLIVGVKGAALTNVIFSKAGAHLLVLSPEQFVDPFFWDIASQRRLLYSEVFCKSMGSHASMPNVDIEVDIAVIERYLSMVESYETPPDTLGQRR